MDPSAYFEMANTEQHHWWFVGRRSILESVIKRLELQEKANILEVGSGTGGNLKMLARYGKVSAIEMDKNARQIAIGKTDGFIDIKLGKFPYDIPVLQERFDLICLFDVLEHIEQDAETLVNLKGLLTENGRILVTVPAYPWLWSIHDEHLHHMRRYSRAELIFKANAAGLRASKLTYFNTLLFPLAVAIRLKDKLFSRKVASGTKMPPRAFNTFLAFLFSSERMLLRRLRFWFGVSLLAVLEAK